MNKKIAFLLTVNLIICMVFSPVVKAEDPFVSIDVPSGINLGSISEPGTHIIERSIAVHVTSNVPYYLDASLKQFNYAGIGSIPLTQTSVAILNAPGSPIPTGPSGDDVDVDLEFHIEITFADQAGDYTGTLVLTVMAL